MPVEGRSLPKGNAVRHSKIGQPMTALDHKRHFAVLRNLHS
jgi:hypothetical protein